MAALGIVVAASGVGLWRLSRKIVPEPEISAKRFLEQLSAGRDGEWIVASHDKNRQPAVLRARRGDEVFAVEFSPDPKQVRVAGNGSTFSIGYPWAAPDWVPVYTGAKEKTLRQYTGIRKSVDFEMDRAVEVLDWYFDELKERGFSVERVSPVAINGKTRTNYVSVVAEPGAGSSWIIHVVY